MGETATRVLVTGAAGGIGAAIAESFAGTGSVVTGLDRERGPDNRVTVVTGDVRDPEAVRRAVATAAPEGRLDVLVLAAGVHDGGADLGTDLDDLAHLLDTVTSINVKGYVLTLAAAAPALRAAGGCVVFVLSDASFLSGGNGAGIAYTASKHADLGVLKWAARALAPDVRVNGVAPGGVRTGLRVEDGPALWGPASGGPAQGDDESARLREARIRGGNPLGVLLTPAQVAHYVRLLADPAAGALTGEILRLDGGRSLVAG